MSADVNLVSISGRLTKDVEIKPVGQAFVLSGSVASNRSVKKDGQYTDVASYFEIKNWLKSEKQVDFFKSNFKKGTKILVVGSLEQESWEKEGQKHARVVINADRIDLMGAPRGGASNDAFPSEDFPE